MKKYLLKSSLLIILALVLISTFNLVGCTTTNTVTQTPPPQTVTPPAQTVTVTPPPATQAPALQDPIKTDAGYVSGTLLGDQANPVHVYRGIPYAAPPVGNLRWKPPQPVTPWTGIREATVYSKSAPQAPRNGLASPTDTTISEDCLYLNVTTPAKKANDALPVMVWMFPGAFNTGTANNPLYNGLPLPQHGVIVVTVNMRPGIMGLLANPLLSKESPQGVSGNYMILDMISSLQWVQKNISAFGGDPKNVTIFGESGGCTKVLTLAASPMAKGLFQKVIAESGFMHGTPLKDAEAMGDKLFTKLGVNSLDAARALSWDKIVNAYEGIIIDSGLAAILNKDSNAYKFFDVTIDGWVMPDMPENMFKTGKANPVQIMAGCNYGELYGPGFIVEPYDIPTYAGAISSEAAFNQKGYVYVFDQVPSKWRQEGVLAYHGVEVPYVFGNLSNNYFSLASSGAKQPDPGVTDTDRKVSEMMMSMWTQFAKTGNPSISGVTWPAYDKSTDQYLYITDTPQAKSGYAKLYTAYTPVAVPVPSVAGPIPVTKDSYPFNAANRQFVPVDLASYGYVEEEYFVSGTANVYDWPGYVAVPTGYSGPYTTRILVRKPAANKFSGNVIVELPNWARGYDVPIAAWGQYWDSLIARGDAWVEVTIRPAVAVRLKKFNATRYASLSFASPVPASLRPLDPVNIWYPYPPSSKETEDGLNWDIISQVGALLKSNATSNPLAGYGVKYLYATGATGGDLSAYVAAIAPIATLDGTKAIYDGYLILMTGSPAMINQYATRIDATDPRCQLHANVPVIRVLTEGDLFGFGDHPDWGYKQRRDDSDSPSDRFRLYEVVGPTIGARYPMLSGPNQTDVEATGEKWGGAVVVPTLEFPLRYIVNGTFINLDQWVRKGTIPPRANRMEIVNSGLPTADFVYDQYKNIKGGVRTPYVDVPIATYPKMGAVVPLEKTVLAQLYKDHNDYVSKVNASVNQLLKDGWITSADADKIKAEAAQANVP